jgi:hypothetical protein
MSMPKIYALWALRLILVVLVLALLLPLHALAWCTMPPPANPSPLPPVQVAFSPVMCWPSAAGISGSGRGYLQKDIPAVPGATAMGGSAWGWWCQKPDLTWAPQSIACLDKYCPATALVAVRSALAASSPGAAVQAMIDTYSVKVTDWSEINDYNCLHVNMLAALQATKPDAAAPTVYKVPPGGSAVYPLVNGKPGLAIAGKRAPGSALCGTPLVAAYGFTYGPYTGSAPNEVAVCQKQ